MRSDFKMDHSENIQKVAVVVAGGVGLRMGAAKPKQFLDLAGRPILVRTVETFLQSYPDMQVVVVLPADHIEEGKNILSVLAEKDRIQYVTGGETRFHSVQNGLQVIKKPAIIFVHDAVRCLITLDLIHRCYEGALTKGSAIPAIAATDSIRLVEEERSRSIPRNNVRLVQTPQTFRSEILIPAYQTPYRNEFTDEASVVEFFGETVHLVDGEIQNIKITGPLDILIAAEYLRSN